MAKRVKAQAKIDETTTKYCSSCGEVKPFEDYYRKDDGTPRTSFCKKCWSAKYYVPNRAEKIQYVTDWKKKQRGWVEPRELNCAHCGDRFTSSKADGKFCSRGCKDAHRSKEQAEARMEAKPDRNCPICGESIPRTVRADKVFCSQSCTQRARFNSSKADRRLRVEHVGDTIRISRAVIYERDGWVCQLCGEPIDRTLAWPDMMRASVDHIVPVSMGGSNETTNLQAAHMQCNVATGNRKSGAVVLRPAPIWEGVEYLSIPKAAALWGISKSRVARLIAEGVIPTLSIEAGANIRIPVEYVEKVLSSGFPEEFEYRRYFKNGFGPAPSKPRTRELTCKRCQLTVVVPVGLTSPRAYCSKACQRDARAERRNLDPTTNKRRSNEKHTRCKICGRSVTYRHGGTRPATCGEPECKGEFRRRNAAAKRPKTRLCKLCGRPFNLRPSGGGRQLKYCSAECSTQASRNRAAIAHLENRERRIAERATAAPPNMCVTCGEEIPRRPGRGNQPKFCTEECLVSERNRKRRVSARLLRNRASDS